MNKLQICFYGDDFTGSTDALEQLTLAGARTMLFIEPPTPKQLARFKDLDAIGVAGKTRALTPDAMERELKPAFKKLKALRAPHVHYKVCSTFDSSPKIGSIGRVIDVAADIFRAPFIPLVVGAPALGRYCAFGNLFARYGIGSAGAIHRLDRHPSVSKHPITPMTEADLRQHLAAQTKKRVALLDITKVTLPEDEARAALDVLLSDKPDAVLFDLMHASQLATLGALLDAHASAKRPLFSVGSSGIEMSLGAHWRQTGKLRPNENPAAEPAKQILIGSGSCSPITSRQIEWALQHGFAEVPLNVASLTSSKTAARELERSAAAATESLAAGKSVIIHTTRSGSDQRIAAKVKHRTAEILGTALGKVLRAAVARTSVRRVCIAGGDTSSYAARAMGIVGLEMIAPLTPGAPLCRAHAAGSPADGCEVVFKGGQVGGEDYFNFVLKGKR